MENRVIQNSNVTTDEGEQILEAIRGGCVDAFVVEERDGHTVYTLQNADLPYAALVQRMQQGAAMLSPNSEIMYCNPSLAALLGASSDTLVGMKLEDLVHPDHRASFQGIVQDTQTQVRETELRLRKLDDGIFPARLSLATLSRDGSIKGVLVTDLTNEKSHAELASRIQRLQDEERRSIARELHDSVGQLLAAISMNLASVRKEVETVNPSLSPMLDDCAVIAQQVSKEIRTISHLLHPPLLDVAGLGSAIRWYVDGFSERSHINIDLQMATDLGRLSNDVEIAVFRVVQECLTNVYRHSGSDSCALRLERQEDLLRLEIRDFGRGLRKPNAGAATPGVGLRGMQERLRQLGGTLQIDSTEKGTTVIALVPVSDQVSEGAA